MKFLSLIASKNQEKVDKEFNIDEILMAVIDNHKSYIKVQDNNGHYAVYQQGVYEYLGRSGVPKREVKEKSTLKKIFKELIKQHNRFEYNGHIYCREWTIIKSDSYWPLELD
ncbi:hypothetical protein [Spongiimicrobium salis]|uniref:hypothetical protein n=1 Tax=Spongiimicrobium salis TaxID=1667022 RepID=UPI00374D764C